MAKSVTWAGNAAASLTQCQGGVWGHPTPVPVPWGQLAGLAPRFQVQIVADKHPDVTSTSQSWGSTCPPPLFVRQSPLTTTTSCCWWPVQEHRCFTRCSRFVTEWAPGGSGTFRYTSTFGPPGTAAFERESPGNDAEREPFCSCSPWPEPPGTGRGSSAPVAAEGARPRYRQGALSPRCSAPGARFLPGTAAPQAEPDPVRRGREKRVPGPGSVGAAPPVPKSQSEQLGLARGGRKSCFISLSGSLLRFFTFLSSLLKFN